MILIKNIILCIVLETRFKITIIGKYYKMRFIIIIVISILCIIENIINSLFFKITYNLNYVGYIRRLYRLKPVLLF